IIPVKFLFLRAGRQGEGPARLAKVQIPRSRRDHNRAGEGRQVGLRRGSPRSAPTSTAILSRTTPAVPGSLPAATRTRPFAPPKPHRGSPFPPPVVRVAAFCDPRLGCGVSPCEQLPFLTA